MLKIDFGEVNHVKCIVCLAMKGKDIILGLKFNILDKYVWKVEVVWDMPRMGKKKGEFYMNKKWNTLNDIAFPLLNKWFNKA